MYHPCLIRHQRDNNDQKPRKGEDLLFDPLEEVEDGAELLGGLVEGLLGADHGHPVQVEHVAVVLEVLRVLVPDGQVPHLVLPQQDQAELLRSRVQRHLVGIPRRAVGEES